MLLAVHLDIAAVRATGQLTKDSTATVIGRQGREGRDL
jgi:hypothetical protein